MTIIEAPASLSESRSMILVANAYNEQGCKLLANYSRSGPMQLGLPVRYLYSHALELYLKAFLRAKELTLDRLCRRPFGHALGKLYAEAQARGLSINAEDLDHVTETIKHLKNGHEDHEFPYFAGSLSTVEPDWIRDAARAVARSVTEDHMARWEAAASDARAAGATLANLTMQAVLSVGGPHTVKPSPSADSAGTEPAVPQ